MNNPLTNLGMSSIFLILGTSFARLHTLLFYIPLITSLLYAMTNVFSSLFQIKSSVYRKGIGVFGEDKGFHSVTHTSSSLQATLHSLGRNEHQTKGPDFVFGIFLLHLFMTKGEETTSRALIIPFLAINAKKGEK
jgi:hypothetical protein